MARSRARPLHLMGLVSDGGVHSHLQHLFALLRMARENKVANVFVHCFMDGRDTPPESGIVFLRQLEQKMREYGVGQIASVSGRYYAMDRDSRWERVEKAYRAMVHGDSAAKFTDPIAAMRASYEKGVTDEFVIPVVITTEPLPGKPAAPRGSIRDGDAVVFFNFRADRARQMTRALIEPGFKEFADPSRPKNLLFVGMTQYEKTWPWLRYLLAPENWNTFSPTFSRSCNTRTCALPRRKNTRTSHTSSTAESKSRFRAKNESLSPRRKFPHTI